MILSGYVRNDCQARENVGAHLDGDEDDAVNDDDEYDDARLVGW